MHTPRTEVEIDPDIFELVPSFCQNRKDELEELCKNLEDNDFESIARTSHTIKGIARPYGFPTLEDFSRQLETAAKAKDATLCKKIIDQAKAYLTQYT